MLEAEATVFVCRLDPPRPTFPMDITGAERAIMGAHGAYWRARLGSDGVIVFGPVGDPKDVWGLAVIRAKDEVALRVLLDADPAITGIPGTSFDVLPMLQAVVMGDHRLLSARRGILSVGATE